MKDTPPPWPPHYDHGGWFRLGSDAPQFRVKGRFAFEFLDPDSGDDPALAAAFYAEDFARVVASEPIWLATGGWEITPGAAGATDMAHTVPFVARHAGYDRTVDGHVVLLADPSHWLRVEVSLGGVRILVAYLDRPWEEFALWPSGATKTTEAPGRIGKRQNWLALAAGAWPALEPLAVEGWFTIEQPGA